MRFIPKTNKLEGEDLMLASNPEKRQLVSHDLNEQEVLRMFKALPWCKCIIDQRFIWFRQ